MTMQHSAQDTGALQILLSTGLPITRPAVTGRIGSFYEIVLAQINATDTVLPIKLGRIPSRYWVTRNQGGGSVQDGSNLGADWTPSQIVLKATIAGKYSLFIG